MWPKESGQIEKTKKPAFFRKRAFSEATIRLELMNKAFAEPPLTNLGTSPIVSANIGN